MLPRSPLILTLVPLALLAAQVSFAEEPSSGTTAADDTIGTYGAATSASRGQSPGVSGSEIGSAGTSAGQDVTVSGSNGSIGGPYSGGPSSSSKDNLASRKRGTQQSGVAGQSTGSPNASFSGDNAKKDSASESGSSSR